MSSFLFLNQSDEIPAAITNMIVDSDKVEWVYISIPHSDFAVFLTNNMSIHLFANSQTKYVSSQNPIIVVFLFSMSWHVHSS